MSQVLKGLCTDEPAKLLDPLIVDWHGILGQIPTVHRHFDDPSPYHGLSEARRATADGRVPPWRFGRPQAGDDG